MTELFKNISSCDATEICPNDNNNTTSENVVPEVDDEQTVVPFVVKAPRADSKLILRNMEEVLNSVKRKHKQKHKRLKEQKKRAQMEANLAAVAAATNPELTNRNNDNDLNTEELKHMDINGDISYDTNSKITKKEKSQHHHHHRHHNQHQHQNALKEKIPLENGISHSKSNKHKSYKKSPIKSTSKPSSSSESILKHFPKTPKKNDALEDSSKKLSKLSKTNAFEMMMNARNKVIGSNTSGIEPLQSPTSEDISTTIANRKLMLQEWADRKGGAKRKQEEDAREAYIEQQLEQRAKKFKQMLVNGAASNSSESPTKNSNDESDTRNVKKIDPISPNKGYEKSKKRGRLSKRKRTESTADNEIEMINEKPLDPETSEFLSKLNSPTKKRDSLLAYFSKKASPSQLADKTKTPTANTYSSTPVCATNDCSKIEIVRTDAHDTPKRRLRRSNLSNLNTEECNTTPNHVTDIESTPSSSINRPKRSCTGKARYDYDLEASPAKNDRRGKSNKNDTPSTSTRASREKRNSNDSNDETDIIILDDSSVSETLNQQTQIISTPKKLAPLFLKAVPKPSLDPEILKARQEFLRSGVPDKLRIEQNKLKQYEQTYDDALEIFPKISHILQFSGEEKSLVNKTNCSLSYKLKPISEDDEEEKIPTPTRTNKRRSKSKSYSFGLLTNCSNQDFKESLQKKFHNSSPIELIQLPSLENKRNIIKSWKNDFDKFPTYKCYNQMREKYRYFSAVDSEQDTEQFSESLVVTRRTTRRSLEAQKKMNPDGSEEEAKPPPTAPNGEILFTEKYKPLMFEQVLVNLTPVTQLKEFLSAWANGNNCTPRNSQNMEDSIDFGNDSNSSHTNTCNSVVLLGPISSGKTNAVFALANEMNFNVLEINAGMKRTGKKLIQELQEATQSHQIKKDSKSQKQLLKMSLNGFKGKKSISLPSNNVVLTNNNSQSQDNDLNSELGQSARKCLILIEDADIVFEQTDAGFIDAIYTLAASSKRPVIVVASNPNCNHLQRLMQQNTIVFNPPNVLNISKYLAVLALIENCPVLLDDLISLHLYNKKDLRKTMHQLQFFIQSGGDRNKYLLHKKDTQKSKKGHPENSTSLSALSKTDNQQFFASPTKSRISEEESDSNEKPDDTLAKSKLKDNQNSEVVIHKSLFEFYTTNQNEKMRVPVPVDFNLLRLNLSDIFQNASYAKKISSDILTTPPSINGKSKRTSRSPKKEWINTAAATTAAANALKEAKKSSIKNLSSFYENISSATLVNGHYNDFEEPKDRLVSYVSEDISHTLVEMAISVNLEAAHCPYNLFETPESRIALTDHLGNTVIRTKRSRYLDFEPNMRSICRSEKLRSSLERRSTRFYHYLRNVSVNASSFGTEHYEDACNILQNDFEVQKK